MLIDLHVHTNRYSACGRSTPEAMAAAAAALGYDAIVLTDHHHLWSVAEAAELERHTPGLRVLRGMEVTASDGSDYLLYGISDASPFSAGMDAVSLLESVHAQDGVVILAHPYRYADTVPEIAEAGAVDGVEVLSNNILAANQGRAAELSARSGMFAVAATDAHHVDSLGLYGVRLARPVADERSLAEALRARAYDLYVDAGRVAAANAETAKHLSVVLDLIAQGYDDRSIRQAVPAVHMVVIQGLRRGADVRRPA